MYVSFLVFTGWLLLVCRKIHHWNGWVQSPISQVEKFICYQCLILLRGFWYWVQIRRSHDAVQASSFHYCCCCCCCWCFCYCCCCCCRCKQLDLTYPHWTRPNECGCDRASLSLFAIFPSIIAFIAVLNRSWTIYFHIYFIFFVCFIFSFYGSTFFRSSNSTFIQIHSPIWYSYRKP